MQLYQWDPYTAHYVFWSSCNIGTDMAVPNSCICLKVKVENYLQSIHIFIVVCKLIFIGLSILIELNAANASKHVLNRVGGGREARLFAVEKKNE